MKDNQVNSLSFSGRPGTLSIQTSQQAARNHSYRCRGIKEDENAFMLVECVFLLPSLTVTDV